MSNRNQIINLKNQKIPGVGNTNLPEANPRYNSTESEKVFEGENNTWITFGRDRPSDIFSGFGGAGKKGCGSIDIVAGRISSMPRESKDGESLVADNNVFLDASRINVNQKTNGDENFFLANGKVGKRMAKAFITLKSDNLRFIAREGIKLVTGTDKYDSSGKLINRIFGIDLIAGNNDKELQPIPKGDNLQEFLSKSLNETVAQHGSELANIYKILIQLCGYLSSHIHPTSTGPTGPSPDLITSTISVANESGLHIVNLQTQQMNLSMNKLNYLEPFGKKYINSRYNNTN